MKKLKLYKCFFDKRDTPFDQKYQPYDNMHSVWFRLPYTKFLDHKVVKIKKYGLFTIYESMKEKQNEN